jgi:16S rRNA (adenine1518-N6/adenine1519-N6)-dimethyltransferase
MITRVKAKKHLGQHFLTDLSIARRIAESLQLSQATPVLEVGPGTGVLTQFLLEDHNAQLTAVEIDTESIAYLKQHFPQLHLIEGDFLRLDLNGLSPLPFALIGNFPYNISSQIFFKALEFREKIPLIVGMLQKEVAERIAEPPGKKAYGILSVFLQAFYDVEYLFTVGAEVFDPPPKVQSAVIRLRRNSREKLNCDEMLFAIVVTTAFNQRRKQLRTARKGLFGKENPALAQPIFDKRPEQLGVEEFVYLTNLLSERK